jgi:hypothetical protein
MAITTVGIDLGKCVPGLLGRHGLDLRDVVSDQRYPNAQEKAG